MWSGSPHNIFERPKANRIGTLKWHLKSQKLHARPRGNDAVLRGLTFNTLLLQYGRNDPRY